MLARFVIKPGFLSEIGIQLRQRYRSQVFVNVKIFFIHTFIVIVIRAHAMSYHLIIVLIFVLRIRQFICGET